MKPLASTAPVGNVTFSKRSRTDYYALCLSSVYDYRLFDDFKADSCLIVYEPEKFLAQIQTKLAIRLPGEPMLHGAVNYFDPLNTLRSDLTVHLSKHFRYAYQFEYRLLWIPEAVADPLTPIDLEFGDFSEFGEIIRLA